MFENIKSVLTSWNASSSERQKLQHVYLVIAVIIVFGSGIVSLINANAGHELVKIALYAVIVFLANAVVWNLLQSSFLSKIPKKSSSKNRRN
ncbi:MAG: hypothetical protein ACR2FM_00425 [Candidatus Saccharimonadales bacterium]